MRQENSINIWGGLMKRLFDLLLSIILLILLSPFLLLIAVLIKNDSPGPVIFRQKRVGQYGEEFIVYKFRTMKNDCPHLPTNDFKKRNYYITGIGKFLRKTSLDELPQLINIFKGEMSFVGPRPVIPSERELVRKRASLGVYRLKPGVTGWAQINGRDHVTITEKAKMDEYYLKNYSLFLDIKIICITAIKVLKREGILEHYQQQGEAEESMDKQKEEVAANREKMI